MVHDADKYREIIGDDEYQRLLLETFQGEEPYRAIHQNLLGIPFQAYITTNYDLCLERASDALGQSRKSHYFPALPLSRIKNQDIYHIHGIIDHDNPDWTVGSVILTYRDYERVYLPGGRIHRFISELYDYHSIVFLGFSFNDEQFEKAIHAGRRSRSDFEREVEQRNLGILKENKHFAIIAYPLVSSEEIYGGKKSDIDIKRVTEEDEKLLSLNIYPIRYLPNDRNHSKLNQITHYVMKMTAGIDTDFVELDREMYEAPIR